MNLATHSEHGKEIRSDMANYTNTRPTVQFSEVKI